MSDSLEGQYCVCVGSRREYGFTNMGTDVPWWVCAQCLLPSRAYLVAMIKLSREESERDESVAGR